MDTPSFIPAETLSLLIFNLILAVIVTLFFYTLRQIRGLKAFYQFLSFTFVYSLVVLSGLIQTYPIPLFPLILATLLVACFRFSFSATGTLLVNTVPARHLVLFQVFRLPLEWVLHQWSEHGTIPSTMSWNGQNFDVVSGLLALLLFQFANIRPVAWFFNLIGFVLLLNVMRVAVLSSPLPFSWNLQNPLRLAFYLPYAWILPICVGGALVGHILLTRSLLKNG